MNRDSLLLLFKEPIPVLDHGYVKLVDCMGTDNRIDEAARTSYGGGEDEDRTPEEVRGLNRYMRRHRHSSPSEHCVITLHVRLPIFVARQFIRHRTQAVSEISGRYTVLKEEFYIPEQGQICYQSTTNGQGRSGPVDEDYADKVIDLMTGMSTEAFAEYHALLAAGVAKETARMVLPLNVYTEWTFTMNAHNLFHMLGLRMEGHAQWEIQEYGRAMAQIVKAWLPFSYEAWEDYAFKAITLSRMEVDVTQDVFRKLGSVMVGMRPMLEAELKNRGCSKREIDDFLRNFMTEGS